MTTTPKTDTANPLEQVWLSLFSPKLGQFNATTAECCNLEDRFSDQYQVIGAFTDVCALSRSREAFIAINGLEWCEEDDCWKPAQD